MDGTHSLCWASCDLNGGTYHAEQYSSAGGVARNIAEAIYKMYGNVHLITAVGNDRNGEYIRQLLPKQCDSSIIKTNDYATCNFSLLHDRQGDCRIIVGDMNAIQAIDPEWIKKNVHLLQQSPLTIIDANISEAVMQTIFRECLRYNRPVFYEPTDMRIAAKPFIGDLALATSARQAIRFSSPNLEELRQLAKALQYPHPMSSTPMEAFQSVDELLDEVKPLGEFVSQIIDNLLVTLGKHGVAIFRRCSDTVPFFDSVTGSYQEPEKQCLKAQGRFYKAHVHPKIVNVSGAGDSFTSGFIVAAIAGKPEPVCVSVGLEAASCALLTRGAVADRYFDETHPSWNANSTAYKTF
uniref:Putative carbohydrate kinase n=1 Tax=Anopheles darlingi TaxID=43151 RepID=A0A2M4CRL9_ANODA